MVMDLANTNENWVYQSNKLIEASFSLTVIEQKLLRILASMVKRDDYDFKEYNFKVKELMILLGIKNNKNFYAEVERISTLLMTRIIKVKEKDKKDFTIYHLIEIAKYYNGTGLLTLKIHPEMKAFYISLDQYTKYQLKNILQFKSTYAFRFYELLKQYQKIGERVFSVEDIRLKLDIGKNEYPKYANLKQKVILVAQKEINTKTDITFNFEEIKKSRKVDSLRFVIKSTETENEKQTYEQISYENIDGFYEESKPIKLIKSIIEEDIADIDAKKIYDAAKGNVDIIKEKYILAKANKHIKNIVAWMIQAIKQDYQLPKGSVKKGSFHNFKQREYDFDALEKKLLEWEDKYDEVATE